MNFKISILVGASLFMILACKSTQQTADLSVFQKFDHSTLPGVIPVNDSLFIDQTEIRNIDWKEYLYFIELAHGLKSEEYEIATPDTQGSLDSISKVDYFYEEEYDNFPVIGITLEQAKAFSIWRSDRVFEIKLIEAGILKPNVDRSYNFTIQDFLRSKTYAKHRKLITHYPEYFIPKESDINAIKEAIQWERIWVGDVNALGNSKKLVVFTGLPVRPVNSLVYASKEGLCENLIGNVSELIDKKGHAVGGSYKQGWEQTINYDIQKEEVPSSSVGFRNLCKWIEIK